MNGSCDSAERAYASSSDFAMSTKVNSDWTIITRLSIIACDNGGRTMRTTGQMHCQCEYVASPLYGSFWGDFICNENTAIVKSSYLYVPYEASHSAVVDFDGSLNMDFRYGKGR